MISYKNIFQAVCFLSNIFKGNLKPHLINEIDDQFVKKYINTNLLKKSNDFNKLEIYLKKLFYAIKGGVQNQDHTVKDTSFSNDDFRSKMSCRFL